MMINNNPTAESLIQGVGNSNTNQKGANNMKASSQTKNNTNVQSSSTTFENGSNITQKIRVLSVKYKVYSFLLIVMILLGYDAVANSYMQYQNINAQIANADQKIQTNIQKSKQYDQDISLVESVRTNVADIVKCLNVNKGCEALPNTIQGNKEIIRTYLQLNTLETEKMIVDEKAILKNINEFLSQSDPFDNKRDYNGTLNSLIIGDTQKEKDHLKSFDIDIGMTFEDKNALLQFVENLEKHVFYQSNNQENPLAFSLMYKIQGIDYDVVKYNDEQEVVITMKGFYYVK